MIDYKNPWIIALSGGPDSMALLHSLIDLQREDSSIPPLVAVHICHNLREDAKREIEQLRLWLRDLPLLQLVFFDEDVRAYQQKENLTIEEAGRKIRYLRLMEVAEALKSKTIITAHHEGDQVESMMMHLLRGSGTKGLMGMEEVRVFKKGKKSDILLVRPFLTTKKEQLLTFIEEKKIPYFIDESNEEDVYFRNKIRLKTLPMLEALWPGFEGRLLHLQNILKTEDDFLQHEVRLFAKKNIQTKEKSIVLKDGFDKGHKALQRRALRASVLQVFDVGLTFQKTDAILDLFHLQSNKKVAITKNLYAKKVFGEILIEKELRKTHEINIPIEKKGVTLLPKERGFVFVGDPESIPKNLQKNFKNHFCIQLEYDKIVKGLSLRHREEGDVFFQNGHHKKLKKMFIDAKIPVAKREAALLIAHDKEILYCDFFGVSHGESAGVKTAVSLYLKKES